MSDREATTATEDRETWKPKRCHFQLFPDDLEIIEAMKRRHGLRDDVAVVRMALRALQRVEAEAS